MSKYTAAKYTSPLLVNHSARSRLITKVLMVAGLCCALLACSKPQATQETPAAAKTIINNVNIVDPVDGLATQQQVVIQEDKIVYVGPVDETSAASNSNDTDHIIDATGHFLIPGLWYIHVHFLYVVALSDVMPELFLLYVVTSVSDTGGDVTTLAALAEALPAPPPPTI